MNNPVDHAIHSTIRACIKADRIPMVAIVAPFTLLHYHREIVPKTCDMVSAIVQVTVLEQGHRVPVVTTANINGRVHRNTVEGSVDLISRAKEQSA